MKKKIYLTGPMRNFSAAQREEFLKAAEFLRQNYNAIVYTALEFYDGVDVKADDFLTHQERIMKKRIAALTESDRVVHLPDFEQDLNATLEIRTAKELNIRVNGITSMTKHELQNENGNEQPHESGIATSNNGNQ